MTAAVITCVVLWAFVLVLLVWLAVRWHARRPRFTDEDYVISRRASPTTDRPEITVHRG